MFVGFSGSTQGSTEIHSIEWWCFSSPPSSASPPRQSSPVFTKNFAPPPPATVAPALSIAEGPSNSNGSIKPQSSSSCFHNSLCRQGPAAVFAVANAGAFFIAACATLGIWAFTRRTKSVKKWDALVAAAEIVKSPREFSYRELVTATRGFNSC
ncbi:L-type lectin-domain containing receptor kinase VIII.1 [Dendrobium catenatum]|uniref:L-type lectin-domain containing receptor kinase VIII.1 n=1 Tax=Dendrobium catenatum TaxID=906689 RepID=A0A2I0VKK1_9ASPA|nr:L-type lectin-domain containing receptor kinase VIII.1 [Dendrobium catenatum]